jgi:hypothetical protein
LTNTLNNELRRFRHVVAGNLNDQSCENSKSAKLLNLSKIDSVVVSSNHWERRLQIPFQIQAPAVVRREREIGEYREIDWVGLHYVRSNLKTEALKIVD